MKNKYHAIRTTIDGITFAFSSNFNSAYLLASFLLTKVISCLKIQVSFVLIPKNENGNAVKYVADFVYNENGKEVVEDTKGVRTPLYMLKKRLLKEVHGIEIKEV